MPEGNPELRLRKLSAAADYYQREAEIAAEAIPRLEGKVEREQERLDSAKAELEQAHSDLEELERQAEDAAEALSALEKETGISAPASSGNARKVRAATAQGRVAARTIGG